MTINTYSRPSPGRLDARTLRERVQLLLGLSLFRQALAEVHQRPGWEADPESLRQLGLVMQRFAPRSKDRGCTYMFARGLYRTAATYTRDPLLRAELLADIGASYFEEGRLDEAVSKFETSLALVRWRHHAHLALLAIACAMRDLAAIHRRCEAFVEGVPCWQKNREAVALLAADPDFAFLRASPKLFLECFGGYPEHLRALHDRYSLEALDQALASFDTPDYAELSDPLEITNLVRQTFDSVGPILRSSACTLHGISPALLQARIGF
jgi:hypothetical protein